MKPIKNRMNNHARASGPRGLMRGLLAGTALAGALVVTLPGAAPVAASSETVLQAQAVEPRAYDIPAGPLASALNRFADESGLQLVYGAELAAGLSTQGLKGKFAAEEGLRRLLAGTGVTWTFAGENSVALSKAQTGGTLMLDTVSVMGTKQSRYNSRHAETGTRFDKDLIEIPRTIDIIPEQLLLDQHAREMEDVYKLSPNTVNADGFGGTREDYIIRGFRREDEIFRNGVRLKSGSRFDPATVDSIQIIKGPVSDIGQMAPGGLVNIITKKPQFEREYHVETNFDEDGERNATFDATGPMGDSENFAYRIISSGDHGETFRDSSKIERQFLATSFSWVGDEGASVRVGHELSNDDRTMDRGLFTVPGDSGTRLIADVPVETAYHSDFSTRQALYNLFELDAAVPIGDSPWSFESKLAYHDEISQNKYVEVTSVSAAGALTRRVSGNDDYSTVNMFGRAQLRGKFDKLAMPTELVAGYEYRQLNYDWVNYSGTNQVLGTVSNPMSSSLVDDSGTPASMTFSDVEQRSFGPYALIDVKPLPDVTLTFGGRYEFYDGKVYRKNLVSNAVTTADQPRDGHLSKTAGVVWNPVKDVALYGSYAETFISQSLFASDQAVLQFDPEQGRQYELGVKWNALGGKLLMNVALFDIEQENVVETVNGTPQLVGGTKTRGIEFSGVGNPLPGWNIRGGFGFLQGEIVSSDASSDGNRPTGVPRMTASVWTSYEFTDTGTMVDGLGVGGGATYVGQRYGNTTHTFTLGNYLLFDVGLWYYLPVGKDKRLRFDLGVKNITDETYYTASGGTFRINAGAPRSVFGGIRLEF